MSEAIKKKIRYFYVKFKGQHVFLTRKTDAAQIVCLNFLYPSSLLAQPLMWLLKTIFFFVSCVSTYLPNPSVQAAYYTRLFFKRSLIDLNSEFSFSKICWQVGQVVLYLSLPPTRQDLTQGQKSEGRLKWG